MSADSKDWSSLIGASPDTSERATSDFLDAQMALSAPKRLMASLRDIMGAPVLPTQKLDRIVPLVAKELKADVCSCFIMRPGELLELFATVGLPGHVAHASRIRVGEGPVGDVAARGMPVIISDMLPTDVQAETGAGKFRAFCGVPIMRGGRVRGVMVVQNKLPRIYGEDAIEVLQTVAMLIAELIVTGGLMSRQEISSGYASGKKPNEVKGASLGRGLAIGTAVLYAPALSMDDIVSEDTKAEKKRLKDAVASMHDAIDKMLSRNPNLNGTESRDILEAYQMFAKDKGWLSKIEAAIEKGLSAEAAVTTVQNETRARMLQMSDAYLRDRLADMEDLSNRLLSHLLRKRQAGQAGVEDLPDDIILIARALGPAALLDYDPSKLKGVVLETGSQSNHVAIVARALGIPVVGQCGDILGAAAKGDTIIVDGDHGTVYINPSDYVFDLYAKSIEVRTARSAHNRRQAQQQSVTKDGIKIGVMMNVGLIVELDAAQASGAEGIGLFRTELSFMAWPKYPLVVTQAELYGKIMDKMGDKPVVFRTLDIGGDKPLPYFKAPSEDNPALGWRAVRIGMDRPAVLRTQFRAFIRGAKGRNLKIMLPFVTEVAEIVRARAFLEMEKDRAREHGTPVPEKIEIGVMLEVPALLFQMDALLKEVDFISVGTNDLMQYIYAADRGNQAIRNRYDPLSPAMLRVLKTIAVAAKAAGVPASVCGEMAGHPLEAMVLVALGFDSLSAPAQSIESIKLMVPTLDTRALVPYLDQLMASGAHSLREDLTAFARDHNVHILQEG